MDKAGDCLTVSFFKAFEHELNCGPMDCVHWRIASFKLGKQVIEVGLFGSCIMQGVLKALNNTLVGNTKMQVTCRC